MERLTFRELHGIERDPNWPHVEGCEGHCMGCLLEDTVLSSGGIQARAFLLERMASPAVGKAAQVAKGKKK
jgi:hypothetical protein